MLVKRNPYKSSFNTYLKNKLKQWKKKDIKFNDGNIILLKYAFITSVFWALKRNNKLPVCSHSDYCNLILPQLF